MGKNIKRIEINSIVGNTYMGVSNETGMGFCN
jgi:hypothetical protein